MNQSAAGDLPEGFGELNPYASVWALATEGERNRARRHSSMRELEAFYQTMLPHMERIIAFLNDRNLHGLNAPEQNLLAMAKSFMEVAISVELFREPDPADAFPADRYRIEEISLVDQAKRGADNE